MSLSRYKKYKESYQAYFKAYYQTNKTKILEKKREWRKKNPDYHQKYQEEHREIYRKNARQWRKNNPEKKRAGNIISHHSEKYPLDSECVFCETTQRLEHGHIDYDFPKIYLTVCHACNMWMDRPIEGAHSR